MTRTSKIAWLGLMGCFLLVGQQAEGQVLQSGATGPGAKDLSTPAMKYFGRGLHSTIPRSPSRRQAPTRQRMQLAGGKPFQNVQRGPSLSPYMQLDTIESSGGLPNYYSRVLPQIQQQEVSQAQAAQLRQLQQQLRMANGSRPMGNHRNVSMPTTGHSPQFLNSGGYFPAIRR